MPAVSVNDSPAELVAIIRAARIAKDRELERMAKQELRDRCGITLRFHGGRTIGAAYGLESACVSEESEEQE